MADEPTTDETPAALDQLPAQLQAATQDSIALGHVLRALQADDPTLTEADELAEAALEQLDRHGWALDRTENFANDEDPEAKPDRHQLEVGLDTAKALAELGTPSATVLQDASAYASFLATGKAKLPPGPELLVPFASGADASRFGQHVLNDVADRMSEGAGGKYEAKRAVARALEAMLEGLPARIAQAHAEAAECEPF